MARVQRGAELDSRGRVERYVDDDDGRIGYGLAAVEVAERRRYDGGVGKPREETVHGGTVADDDDAEEVGGKRLHLG